MPVQSTHNADATLADLMRMRGMGVEAVRIDDSEVIQNGKTYTQLQRGYSCGDAAAVLLSRLDFDRMKALASSQVQSLLPNLGRNRLLSSKDIASVKSSSDEFHLAIPPSVSSYAMPACSFIQYAMAVQSENIRNHPVQIDGRQMQGHIPAPVWTVQFRKARSLG